MTRPTRNGGLLAALLMIFGCGGENIVDVTSAELKERWLASVQHSAESWWYAGDKEGQHVFVVKRPGDKSFLGVPIDSVNLSFESTEFSTSSNDWKNIKTGDIEFP